MHPHHELLLAFYNRLDDFHSWMCTYGYILVPTFWGTICSACWLFHGKRKLLVAIASVLFVCIWSTYFVLHHTEWDWHLYTYAMYGQWNYKF